MSTTSAEPVVDQATVPPASTPPIEPPRTRTVPRRRGFGSRAAVIGPPLAVLVVLLGGWYAVSIALAASGKGFLMPMPHEMFTLGFFDPQVGADIWIALFRTTGVALTGLAVAMILGIGWAIAMSLARWVERSTYAYAVMLQCIPILALVPLVGFWFGYEFTARVIVCVLIALFPMVSNTLFGLQSVDKSQRELFRLQKANKWTVLTKLTLPAALPSIFVGMRTSAGLSVIGAIVGDYFFRRGEPGIGSLIANYQSRLQSAELFAAILAACLLGVAIFAFFGWLSKVAVGRWYESAL
ncbi:NitT/TauT family transport system permease protein [Microbacterium sp. ru370.1]|uniref:ABC transporter permease n=1 Tax=unclassified Microbacterium TaxID=2609290 RepID=UPI00088E50D9|nr:MULTISPECIES: ABC transporter permease [unclassified Microbacterium]SDO38215.1 NitT/TauT family transport system permease protein [Microbacterium sp. ru370.1]SIT78871.1 NitT/TauT family transport system permease protein [Microbacterium sp. RU1D]